MPIAESVDGKVTYRPEARPAGRNTNQMNTSFTKSEGLNSVAKSTRGYGNQEAVLDRKASPAESTKLQLQNSDVNTVFTDEKLTKVLTSTAKVFREELELCKDFQSHLLLNLVLNPTDHANWATPIVAVQNQGKSFRTFADLISGLNDLLDAHRYPLPYPHVQDIDAHETQLRSN